MLADKYADQIQAIIACYPAGHRRAAVMPLLYLAQQEYGHLSPQAIDEVADVLGMDPTQVGGLVRFYTLFHERPGGKYYLQICTDLPCALQGAEEFSAQVCQRLGVRPNATTEDGLFSVEEVMCLAACHRAPLFQVQDADGIHYHENQTVESAMKIVESLRHRESESDG